MQGNSQISTTPPLPGTDLVAQINSALQTIGTDFAGSDDPAGLAWPYALWADTGAGRLKRRNAADTAWVDVGGLLAPDGTEANSGILKVATTALSQGLVNDTTAITPKKLADAFKGPNQSLLQNGYQRVPGGLIHQWGITSGANPNQLGSVVFPVSFPSGPLVIFLQYVDSGSNTGAARGNPIQVSNFSAVSFNFYHSGTANGCQFFWTAWGL